MISRDDFLLYQSLMTGTCGSQQSIADGVAESVEEREALLLQNRLQNIPSTNSCASDEVVPAYNHEAGIVIQCFLHCIERITYVVKITMDNCAKPRSASL